MKKVKLALQELTWSEIRDEVAKVNSEVTDIIDAINPDDSYTVFRARYPFGAEMQIEGKMYFPTTSGEMVEMGDPLVGRDIQEKLGYTFLTNPMAMLIKNTMEMYIRLDNRIIPYALISPGKIFGAWKVLDNIKQEKIFFMPIPIWNVTSGARSIFLLPKISEVAAFYKLQKKFNLPQLDVPKHLNDHWSVFKALASQPAFPEQWESEIIFFSKKWADTMHDPAWGRFKSYVADAVWQGSEFWRSQFCWDLTLTRIQSERGIRPAPYITDIANHLLAMSAGAVPSLQPLVDNSVAPLRGIQHVFEEEYGLKYAPIIIGPTNYSVFDESRNDCVYYSFNYPTALKLSPKSSNRASLVTDLYNVRWLVDKYLEDIVDSELGIAGTALYEIAKKVKINYCHYVSTEETRMTSSHDIIFEDPNFQLACKGSSIQTMPKNAPFLNGCVQISRQKQK